MLIIKAYNSTYISLIFSKQFLKNSLGSKYTRQLCIKINFETIISVMKTLHLRWKANKNTEFFKKIFIYS